MSFVSSAESPQPGRFSDRPAGAQIGKLSHRRTPTLSDLRAKCHRVPFVAQAFLGPGWNMVFIRFEQILRQAKLRSRPT